MISNRLYNGGATVKRAVAGTSLWFHSLHLIGKIFVILGVVIATMLVGLFLNRVYAATVNLDPDSMTINTGTWYHDNGFTANSASYSTIAQGSSPTTATHLKTALAGAGAESFTVGMSNQANIASATQLQMFVYARSATNANGGTIDTLSLTLATGGTTLATGTVTPAYTTSSTWAWYSTNLASGSWNQSQIDGLQGTITRNMLGTGPGGSRDDDIQIASVYVAMTYTATASYSQVAYRWFGNEADPTGVPGAPVGYIADTTGSSVGVALGDFNGDGVLDSVSANLTANSITILLGAGEGTFGTGTNISNVGRTEAVAVGYFDSDNWLDIAATDRTNDTVGIFIGNGDGTFDARVGYTTGDGPTGFDVADVDGDSELDLITANTTAGTISVLLGNGDGTFDAKVDYSVDTNAFPGTIESGYFDGDTALDLAVNNRATNAISIFIGNGDGTFDAKVDYTTGTNPYDSTQADFDGDGNVDLAVITNQATGSLSVLMGNGDGTFDTHTTYSTENWGITIINVDFDHDGKTDLIVGADSGNFKIHFGNGDGTFGTGQTYSTGDSTYGIESADINADGANDLVAAGYYADSLFVMLGQTTLTNPLAAQDTYAVAPTPGTPLRLRFNIGVANAQMDTGTSFKLQYKQQATGSCSATVGTYTDITTGTPIKYYNDPSITTGTSFATSADDPVRSGITVVRQTYRELSPFTNTIAIPAGQDGMWDMSLTFDGGAVGGSYCIKVVTNAGADLSGGYTAVPRIDLSSRVVQAAYRMFENSTVTESGNATVGAPLAAVNTAATIPEAGTPFRMRLNLGNEGSVLSSEDLYKIQVAERGVDNVCHGTNGSGETYVDIGSSTPIKLYDNAALTNLITIASSANDPLRPGVSSSLRTYNEDYTFSPYLSSLAGGLDGIWDFALTADSSATPGAHYCIRATTLATALLQDYLTVAEVIIPGPAGPTLQQQLRGGQGVVEGIKSPFTL